VKIDKKGEEGRKRANVAEKAIIWPKRPCRGIIGSEKGPKIARYWGFWEYIRGTVGPINARIRSGAKTHPIRLNNHNSLGENKKKSI